MEVIFVPQCISNKLVNSLAGVKAGGSVSSRVVSPEISSGKFPEIYSIFPVISGNFLEIFIFGKLTEIFTKNTVQTFQITVYLFTSSLSIGCYSTYMH